MGTQYFCKSGERRDAVRAARDANGKPFLNGFDFLEVASDQMSLTVRFIHNLPGSGSDEVPANAAALTADNLRIEGGERGRDVQLATAPVTQKQDLMLAVNKPGDFSIYRLRLVQSPDDPRPPAGFDPQLAEIELFFKAECPQDFDCKPKRVCPAGWTPPPEISYLAKDYASFRQLMLDRLALLLPEWKERQAADLGVALVELLAYVADHLSYQQDAVATEAYLGTARRRTSVRRHARLVDYVLHDGCNARVWAQVRLAAGVAQAHLGPVTGSGAATKLLTRVEGRPEVIAPDAEAPAAGPVIFELMHEADLFSEHQRITFYTWAARECCLPKGATRATLKESLPNLKRGDLLVFQEAIGPHTGEAEDADPARRHAVRLIKVDATVTDPLNGQAVTEIEWHEEDALPFPFCLSSRVKKAGAMQDIDEVSVALGNIVLADHGATIARSEDLGEVPAPKLFRLSAPPTSIGAEPGALVLSTGGPVPPRFRPRLQQSPLTFSGKYPFAGDDKATGSAASALRGRDVRGGEPALRLMSDREGIFETWQPQRDLLNSDQDDRHFVVEVESDGTAWLRFGANGHGAALVSGTKFSATYRVGNGPAGNIGPGTLAHIVTDVSGVVGVANPLPAQGGVSAETIAEARQNAPSAFRTQERAVTPDDYAAMALRHRGLQRAAATLRWTGSWHTVFVTGDRLGGAKLTPDFEDKLRRHLEKFRMAGHDVEIDDARLVPLELAMHVCVEPDYFRADVKAALLELFSDGVLTGGRRGVFHPDNFTFGQSVFLSRLYAAAESVAGVASVSVTTFQRQGQNSGEALKAGELKLGRLEIAVLENNPNFPDHGVFRLEMDGGK